jgi:acyl-CoA reductase-like NAD-dependent aldehyde dehydrogenase
MMNSDLAIKPFPRPVTLDAGLVGVSEWRSLRAEIPFGGIKSSGLGHEGGEEGLREFCELKVIATTSAATWPDPRG